MSGCLSQEAAWAGKPLHSWVPGLAQPTCSWLGTLDTWLTVLGPRFPK